MAGNGSYEVMAEFNGNMISCGIMTTINGDGSFACDFGTALAGSVSANFGLDGSGLEGQVSVDVTPEITVSSPTEGSLHGGATVTVSGAGFDEMSAIFVTVNGNQVSEIIVVFFRFKSGVRVAYFVNPYLVKGGLSKILINFGSRE